MILGLKVLVITEEAQTTYPSARCELFSFITIGKSMELGDESPRAGARCR